jgi:hypothetical protein
VLGEVAAAGPAADDVPPDVAHATSPKVTPATKSTEIVEGSRRRLCDGLLLEKLKIKLILLLTFLF